MKSATAWAWRQAPPAFPASAASWRTSGSRPPRRRWRSGKSLRLTRLPSGRRASTIGCSRRIRRPTPATMRLTIRSRWSLSRKWSGGQFQVRAPLHIDLERTVDQDVVDACRPCAAVRAGPARPSRHRSRRPDPAGRRWFSAIRSEARESVTRLMTSRRMSFSSSLSSLARSSSSISRACRRSRMSSCEGGSPPLRWPRAWAAAEAGAAAAGASGLASPPALARLLRMDARCAGRNGSSGDLHGLAGAPVPAASRSTKVWTSLTIFDLGRWVAIGPPRLTEARRGLPVGALIPASALRCRARSASAMEGRRAEHPGGEAIEHDPGLLARDHVPLDFVGQRAGGEQGGHGQFGHHQHLVATAEDLQGPGTCDGVACRGPPSHSSSQATSSRRRIASRGTVSKAVGSRGAASRWN